MYEHYWNLDRRPFDNSSEREFFFPAECHQGALLKLRYAVENRRGAALLTGGAGTGKTMLVARLFETLESNIEPRVHVVFPRMGTEQLIAFLGTGLTGAPLSSLAMSDAIRSVQEFLAANSANGQHALLVIDEAHLLESRETLDTLRLLLNFQTEGSYDLTLLLIGQPQIVPTVQRVAGLDDRMTVKCLLRPFSETETANYINHRLTVAGGATSYFTDESIAEVYRHTLGVPGRINRLCDLALLIAFDEERKFIEAEQICEVAEEIMAIGDRSAA